ncbi:hypothetical protein EJ06DRAFT_581170 [Trichodelitschia bisporula]|uniref:Zn(2)-C6 fungal-type domain-containing protein n=1 Tax=Trichodelitschia bisporula TaxID=703511 RepID=A0A6G1I1M1_9PEZI|nr:hypothetical protein EJ06DRAFT_581170 [Trichodelitschia bisporula]
MSAAAPPSSHTSYTSRQAQGQAQPGDPQHHHHHHHHNHNHNHNHPNASSPDPDPERAHSLDHHLNQDNDDDHNPPGSWSPSSSARSDTEPPSSHPTKRRKHNHNPPSSRPLSVSCETCKQRKVKCDRGLPACGWCTKNGQRCEYKARKKPGLRAGYGRELEGRLAEQAGLIDQIRATLHRHDITLAQLTAAPPPNPPALPPAFRDPPPQQPSQSPHTPLLPRPDLWPKPMFPPTYPASAEYADSRPSHGYATAHMQEVNGALPPLQTREMYAPDAQALVAGRGGANGAGPGAKYGADPGVGHAARAEPEFPAYDVCEHLVDLFFAHVNPWCPLLHQQATVDALFKPALMQEEEKILLHAIIATTLRFSTDVRLTDEVRVRQHKVSKERVQLYGLEYSSVRSLQALVILTLDLVGDSNGPPGWNMLALISRAVVQLGLAVESTSLAVAPAYPSIYTLRTVILPEPKDFIEDESRRRLFWVIFLLDRYATIATAFDFALDEKEIDRRLPCRDDFFISNRFVETRWFKTAHRSDYTLDKPENLGSFGYYIEVIGILSRIHQFLKQPVDISALPDVEQWQRTYRALDSELQTWQYNLPPEHGNMSRAYSPPSSKNPPPTPPAWIMLHATFHTTMIRLHSSAAYPTTRSPIFTPSFSAAQRCQSAVEHIAALTAYVVSTGQLPHLGPPFAFALWVAARVLLVHGCTLVRRVSRLIHPLVDALHVLGRSWRVAARYADLLARVLDEYRESEATPGGGVPRSVTILADMRRTAFDLDALISRQPRGGGGAVGGQGAGGGAPVGVQPSRADLEYLDVFDFFNVPRLAGGVGEEGGMEGEFNITNFMVDASADWLGGA